MKPQLAAAVALVGATMLLTGCSSPAPARPESDGLSGSITVDAAASLTGIFDSVAVQFEKKYPGTHVTFNYGGSASLAAAIIAGAPVDVFAAASPATMALVTKAKLGDGSPQVFVKNELEIAVPAGNPGAITGLKDFADPSKKIALCDPAQPCGAAAQAVFRAEKIEAKPDTLEPDVKSALTKVSLGEVDAALVYRTDVLAAGSQVEGIPFPEAGQFIVSYPIVTITGSAHAKLAAAFAKFVQGAAAQKILGHAGFITN